MLDAVRALGLRSLEVVAEHGRIARFGGSLLRATLAPPARPGRVVQEIFDIGVLSLVIICISGAAVGMVLGLQGYNTLVRFGAEQSLGALVGLSLVRELGPVLTGLLVTGRAGSAVAAEIGTMVATEQLDGLRMMSVDPVHLVAMPKAVAMMIAMPLLSALFTTCGILGGYLAGVRILGVDSGTYFSSLEGAVVFRDDIVGSLLKAVIFGVIVGLIATYRGYTSRPTSAGVSASTTGTVVVASVTILISDYFITALWGV
jgi:phospholipid/cholesterol/gamma-HCH transport system permease protein